MSDTCVFCHGEGGMSREHVLPAWMSREFTEIAGSSARFLSLEQHADPVDRGAYTIRHPYLRLRDNQRPFSRRAKVVCKSCNNGWMSRLEAKVRPTLAKVVRGSCIALGTEGQTALAAWLLKTMLMEYKAPSAGPRAQQPPMVPQVDYTRFYNERAPSSEMRVALATMQPPREGPRLVFYDSAIDQMRSENGKTGYCATLRLGYFVAQLLRIPDGVPEETFASVLEPPLHLVQLWPATPIVLWPPPAPIRDDQWESFIRLPEGDLL
ncbi:hypothetical protein HNR06_000957 [Nocardiopsis arvandica]|uniref:HNH endonuclease 5 domain-containing protein n=1 Tax=Nocardiopsis sinuspersici TaxID=501010 RepID=A0A7Y9X980_9ACTN|nr:hypothetical protein [Nocardiopsis sinuspersici]NYH51368.1 hypothetical protein [Nocardiopsis sinuspersici]